MILAKIHVMLKASVLDPQGSAVTKSLHALGYDEVQDVRVGKFLEVRVDTLDHQTAQERVTEMCEKLLVNTVIESYSFVLSEVHGQVAAEGTATVAVTEAAEVQR